jgi:hypothetical protein
LGFRRLPRSVATSRIAAASPPGSVMAVDLVPGGRPAARIIAATRR